MDATTLISIPRAKNSSPVPTGRRGSLDELDEPAEAALDGLADVGVAARRVGLHLAPEPARIGDQVPVRVGHRLERLVAALPLGRGPKRLVRGLETAARRMRGTDPSSCRRAGTRTAARCPRPSRSRRWTRRRSPCRRTRSSPRRGSPRAAPRPSCVLLPRACSEVSSHSLLLSRTRRHGRDPESVSFEWKGSARARS